ncbi:MAG: tripartite tricarboxylate transporter TctB family protein [Burkholderiales bacterium]|nr:tripartite tricarboxylate transporter TctB family protein [Burkholderiales bacterium]
MAQSKWIKGDVVSGAVLAALGAYIVSEAWRWDYSTAEGPGPGFFPTWYGIAMLVLALVLMLRTAFSAAEQDGKTTDWVGIGRALTVWAAFTLCIVLMKFLGFLTALALLTLFIVAVMYGRPLKVALAAAVGNAAGFYLVFGLALQLSLPAGPLGF